MPHQSFDLRRFVLQKGPYFIIGLGGATLIYFIVFLVSTTDVRLSSVADDWKAPVEFLSLLFTPYLAIVGSYFLWRQILREEEGSRLGTYMLKLEEQYKVFHTLTRPTSEEVLDDDAWDVIFHNALTNYRRILSLNDGFLFEIHRMHAGYKAEAIDDLIVGHVFSIPMIDRPDNTDTFVFTPVVSSNTREQLIKYLKHTGYSIPGITD